jgi:hypothetical protein
MVFDTKRASARKLRGRIGSSSEINPDYVVFAGDHITIANGRRLRVAIPRSIHWPWLFPLCLPVSRGGRADGSGGPVLRLKEGAIAPSCHSLHGTYLSAGESIDMET